MSPKSVSEIKIISADLSVFNFRFSKKHHIKLVKCDSQFWNISVNSWCRIWNKLSLSWEVPVLRYTWKVISISCVNLFSFYRFLCRCIYYLFCFLLLNTALALVSCWCLIAPKVLLNLEQHYYNSVFPKSGVCGPVYAGGLWSFNLGLFKKIIESVSKMYDKLIIEIVICDLCTMFKKKFPQKSYFSRR